MKILFRSRHTARGGGQRQPRGSTFAELMLATLIIGTTVVGASSSLRQSASVYHYFTDGPHEALMLAQEIHEAAVSLPWEDSSEAAFGSDVAVLWDLDEQQYHPPRSASHDVVVSHSHWTQDVSLDYVDLDNPNTVVDPDEFGGETLVRLKVAVSIGDHEVDAFHWWMTEPEDVD
ncbi:MAG: hypothetical protein DRQ55_02730 [Planctomycetota bacterium]|nr:MAG: hypothetical protein DRQ55_02730 [Planctomycetota bacterium]